MPAKPRFFMIDIAVTWDGLVCNILVTTDVPCHLTMRYQQVGLEVHRRISMLRGVPFDDDPHLGFDNYLELEQEEAGDTETHSFALAFPHVCKIFYFIWVATIGGIPSLSQTPLWWEHCKEVPPPPRPLCAHLTSEAEDALIIVDVSNPARPSYRGHITGQGSPNFLDSPEDVFVVLPYAYVCAYRDNGLTIINVTNPAAPWYVGGIYGQGSDNWLGGAKGNWIENDRAHVVSFDPDDSWSLIDISNPADPTLIAAIPDIAQKRLEHANKVHVVGDYAYVAAPDHSSLVIIRWDPGNIVGCIDKDDAYLLTGIRGVYQQGDYAYCVSPSTYYGGTFVLINVTDKTNPTYTAGQRLYGNGPPNYLDYALDIQCVGHYAFIVCAHDGFTVIDIEDPDHPTFVANLPASANHMYMASGIHIVGNYAYVSAEQGVSGEDGALAIVDISDPTNPFLKGHLDWTPANHLKGLNDVYVA